MCNGYQKKELPSFLLLCMCVCVLCVVSSQAHKEELLAFALAAMSMSLILNPKDRRQIFIHTDDQMCDINLILL